MLKKTLTFKDVDGNEITEDFYFHLSKAELAKMELVMPGGMAEHLKSVIASQDGAKIIETFEKFITAAYGVRSEDGRRFIKTAEVLQEFMETDAYSEYFFLLCTDAEAGAEFVRGIIPGAEDMKFEDLPDIATLQLPGGEEKSESEKPKAPQEMTREELLAAYQQKEQEKTS